MKLIWLVVVLSANSVVAQGTSFFTWHGYSNEFAATLQIPEWPNVLHSHFDANILGVMQQTAVFVDPWGNKFSIDNSEVDPTGGVDDYGLWWIDITMANYNNGLLVSVVGNQGATGDRFHEFIIGGSQIAMERGWWSVETPEPGPFNLLLLGVVMWVLNGLRARL